MGGGGVAKYYRLQLSTLHIALSLLNVRQEFILFWHDLQTEQQTCCKCSLANGL